MKRLMILVTATLLVIGSTLNAQACNGSGYGNRSGSRFERMQTMLNLTDEQTKKISDLRFEHEQMALEARSEVQKNRLVVRKMMVDNKIDQAKLLKITNENSELQGKIKLSRTTMWLEVYNMLDDNQKENWAKTFGQFKQNSGRNFHKQGRGGFGYNDGGRFHQRRMR